MATIPQRPVCALEFWLISGLLVVHCATLVHSACIHSPVFDELGHIGAGISHWKSGRFDQYAVNPPLVRLVATLPLVYMGYTVNWANYSTEVHSRSEFLIARDFAADNHDSLHLAVVVSRLACIPFCLLGALTCYCWSRCLFGASGGLLSLALWCVSPTVVAHGSMLTPDTHAAATGTFACFLFYRWCRVCTWRRALVAGIVLGLAVLTKFTWILLFPAFPLVWLLHRDAGRSYKSSVGTQARHVIVVLCIGLFVVNCGYLFQGSGRALSSYSFRSSMLSGGMDGGAGCWGRDTAIGSLPVPLPANMVSGIDEQKFEFERGYRSYLRGEFRDHGWWYYYAYGCIIKEPVGSVALFLIAAIAAVTQPVRIGGLRHTAAVFLPGILVFAVVSCEQGFNHHLRYVLPAIPFCFVFAGASVHAFPDKSSVALRLVPLACVVMSVFSSASRCPHYTSYFNEFAGGPSNGWKHMDCSNTDWGQDLIFVQNWQERHPDLQPQFFAIVTSIDPAYYGIRGERIDDLRFRPLRAGWYIISVHLLVNRVDLMEAFRDQEPVALIGGSHRVYRVLGGECSSGT